MQYQASYDPVDVTAELLDVESLVPATEVRTSSSRRKFGVATVLSGVVLLALACYSTLDTTDVVALSAPGLALASGQTRATLLGSTGALKRSARGTRATRRPIVQLQASAKASTGVASGYASALLEAAQSSGELEAVHTDLVFLAEYLKANEPVAKFLASPVAEAGAKKGIVEKLHAEVDFNPLTLNFLKLLVDKKRMSSVMPILEEFVALYFETTGTQIATVTSAVPLDEDQQLEIVKKLRGMTKADNIKLKLEIDSALLGGFVVQYGKDGSGLIDMSVKGQVKDLSGLLSV